MVSDAFASGSKVPAGNSNNRPSTAKRYCLTKTSLPSDVMGTANAPPG